MQDAERGARQRRRDALDAGGAASRRRAARRARLRPCPPARPRRAPAPAPAVEESPPRPHQWSSPIPRSRRTAPPRHICGGTRPAAAPAVLDALTIVGRAQDGESGEK